MSVTEDLKQISEKLHSLFEDFKKENHKRLEKLEKGQGAALSEEYTQKLNDRLDELEGQWKEKYKEWQRPDDDAEGKKQKKEVNDAFNAFLRMGPTPEQLKALRESAPKPAEAEALERQVQAKAAYLGQTTGSGLEWVPDEFVTELFRDVTEMSPVRSVARVRPTSFGKVTLSTHTGAGAAARSAEAGARDDAGAATSANITLTPSELQARYDSSREALADIAFNLEAEMRFDMAEQIAVKEGNEYIKGNGTAPNPQGFLANVGTAVEIGATPTAANLIDLFYAVKSDYARNGTWMMRRSTIQTVRKLEDSGGSYVWTMTAPGNLSEATPATLLGRPVLEAPDIDAIGADASGNRPVAFGDFRRGYIIVDQVGFQLLVDPYSAAATGTIRFYGYVRNMGKVLKAEALAALNQ
jgi:HK97 family phage major capsid protein